MMRYLPERRVTIVVLLIISHLYTARTESTTFQFCNGSDTDQCNTCQQLKNDGTLVFCDRESQPCFCFEYFDQCVSSADCSAQEACVHLLPFTTASYCAPCNALANRSPGPVVVDDLHSCTVSSPNPTSFPPSPQIPDDTFNNCSNDADCNNVCATIETTGLLGTCSTSSFNCFCVESVFAICDESADCLYGEACVYPTQDAVYPQCMSCDGIARRSPSPSFVDTQHYCQDNVPDVMAADDTFRYCRNAMVFDSCDKTCVQLLNNGSVSTCDLDTHPCFCLDNYETCETSANCLNGYACVALLNNGLENYCASCDAIARRSPAPVFVDTLHNCPTPSPLPTPYQPPSIPDDTFEECSDNSDCSSLCAAVDSQGRLANCSSTDDCFCVKSIDNSCLKSEECVYGAACINIANKSNYSYCMSCNGINNAPMQPLHLDDDHFCDQTVLLTDDPTSFETDSPSFTEATTVPPEDDGVCLATHHIGHLRHDELVYTSHRRASVLCDRFGNCATPGHMIVFNGAYMMMQTYCTNSEYAQCVRRLIFVNSPRMKRRLRIASSSNDLSFTAMAAKYATKSEERILAFLLELGF